MDVLVVVEFFDVYFVWGDFFDYLIFFGFYFVYVCKVSLEVVNIVIIDDC